MGAESYLVRLSGSGATLADVRAALADLPGVTPDSGMLPSCEYFVCEYQGGVFEMELSDRSPPVVSVRFTLAHPPTVDATFLALVRQLMTDTGLRVRVLSDHASAEYDLAHFDHFSAAVLSDIARERRLWIGMFGPETLAASTAEVFERIILPRCEPTPALKVSR